MWLDFKITNRCNNSCTYCGVKHDNIQAKETLPIEAINKTISSALDLGFENFAFLGGEPSVSDNICDLFSSFKNRTDTKVLVITNGIIYNEKMVDCAFSCKSKEAFIVQSFDSFKKPNYKNQDPGFVLDNIKLMINTAKKYETDYFKRGVHVHSVISRENLNNVYDLVDYFFSRNIDISLGLVCPSTFENSIDKRKCNNFSFKELELILNQLEKLNDEKKLNKANCILMKYLTEFPYGKVKFSEECKAGREHVIIDQFGEVFPCVTQSYLKEKKYGNIKETPFEDIFSKLKGFKCNDDFAPACWDHYLWSQIQ
ncbi:MAG: radical SAM protein [Candidatus Delongbacteria bacterium]|jgi:MoaA/NifB/PqqE/SkfB family radical SAM enzyme|nr:radical SAM protein [Candidatus Delongbacteria bacterium]